MYPMRTDIFYRIAESVNVRDAKIDERYYAKHFFRNFLKRSSGNEAE
jgi:hypothetical protein